MTLLDLTGRRRADTTTPLPARWAVNTIPTYERSGSTVHPSIVDMGRKWNGYRWWQANTPFPADNERYENPCIWGSNDRINWAVPAGLVNPIDLAPPAPGYNSDTELFWDPDGQQMVLYWRQVAPAGNAFLKAATSTNGNSWHPQPISLALTGLVSPAVCKNPAGGWLMWLFNDTSMWSAPTPLGPWTREATCTFDAGHSFRWHGDVIRHKGRWYGAYGNAPDRDVYTMVSDNGVDWTVSPTPATPYSAYRPTFVPSTVPDHIDMWCGTTAVLGVLRVHESIWPA